MWTVKQIASSRIWTRITDSVYYDDNRYAKCTSFLYHVDVNTIFIFNIKFQLIHNYIHLGIISIFLSIFISKLK